LLGFHLLTELRESQLLYATFEAGIFSHSLYGAFLQSNLLNLNNDSLDFSIKVYI